MTKEKLVKIKNDVMSIIVALITFVGALAIVFGIVALTIKWYTYLFDFLNSIYALPLYLFIFWIVNNVVGGVASIRQLKRIEKKLDDLKGEGLYFQ